MMKVSSETRRQGFRYYAKYYQTHTQTAKASGLAAKLIGLGTVARSMMHKGRMYDRLKSIQGKLIPIYLGNIDLDRPWLDLGVRIIHMLLS